MDKLNLMPQPAQPVYRTTPGQLPPELAELSEEALSLVGAAASSEVPAVTGAGRGCAYSGGICSYDGDDGE